MTGPAISDRQREDGGSPIGIRPTRRVRQSEVKQALQKSSSKPPTSKNRVQQRRAQQARCKRRRKREGDGKRPVQIKADGTERLRTPGNSSGKERTPEEQGSKRKLQPSAPEEAERSDGGVQALQWCKRPEGAEQIKRHGVTENTPTKQTNQTGWWNKPWF